MFNTFHYHRQFPFFKRKNGESRRIMYEGAPTAPADGSEVAKQSPDTKGKSTDVENKRTETNDRVRNAAGKEMDAVDRGNPRSEPRRKREPREPRTWKTGRVLEEAPAMLKTGAKAVATIGIVANPIGFGAIAAGGYGAAKTWGVLKKMPGFKQVDAGARFLGRGAVEGVKSVGRTVAYPFRLGGAAASDALGVVGAAYYATIGEGIRDMTEAINSKYGLPEGTNMIASALIEVKRALLASVTFPFKLIGKIPEIAEKVLVGLASKPMRTMLGIGLGYAMLTNPAAVLGLVDKAIAAFSHLITTMGWAMKAAPLAAPVIYEYFDIFPFA